MLASVVMIPDRTKKNLDRRKKTLHNQQISDSLTKSASLKIDVNKFFKNYQVDCLFKKMVKSGILP
jgi:hypothetical protein